MVGQEYIPWYAWYAGSPYSFKTASLTPQPNNARDFYRTGVNRQYALGLSGGEQKQWWSVSAGYDQNSSNLNGHHQQSAQCCVCTQHFAMHKATMQGQLLQAI